ncbi:hypothetical protein [Spirosoma areae]
MEEIIQLLDAYYCFRDAVLRSTPPKLPKSVFTKITGLDVNAKYRRQANPGLWKPAEIRLLAVELGLSDATSNRLQGLAPLITLLTESEKKSVYKACSLTDEKLSARLANPDSWQPYELDKLKRLVVNRVYRGIYKHVKPAH